MLSTHARFARNLLSRDHERERCVPCSSVPEAEARSNARRAVRAGKEAGGAGMVDGNSESSRNKLEMYLSDED